MPQGQSGKLKFWACFESRTLTECQQCRQHLISISVGHQTHTTQLDMSALVKRELEIWGAQRERHHLIQQTMSQANQSKREHVSLHSRV